MLFVRSLRVQKMGCVYVEPHELSLWHPKIRPAWGDIPPTRSLKQTNWDDAFGRGPMVGLTTLFRHLCIIKLLGPSVNQRATYKPSFVPRGLLEFFEDKPSNGGTVIHLVLMLPPGSCSPPFQFCSSGSFRLGVCPHKRRTGMFGLAPRRDCRVSPLRSVPLFRLHSLKTYLPQQTCPERTSPAMRESKDSSLWLSHPKQG